MIAKLFAVIAVLGTAVVYGTDVFCAMVQRPALARVDDRALLAVMGNIHRYGDRRMPVPGVLGLVAAAISAVFAAASGRWAQAARGGCRRRPAAGVAGALPASERADQPPTHRRGRSVRTADQCPRDCNIIGTGSSRSGPSCKAWQSRHCARRC